MTVLSVSIREYLVKFQDSKTKQIAMGVPFSIRPPPKSAMDFEFNNQFAILPLELDLHDTYDGGFAQVKRKMDAFKRS